MTGLAQKIIELDESMREIAALGELYKDIVDSKPADEKELELRKDEAKFARDRILKLSLHAKNLLGTIESQEPLK
jgi:hypothetical protein